MVKILILRKKNVLIVAPVTDVLLHRKHASLGMSLDSCGNQDTDKRNALYLLREQHRSSKQVLSTCKWLGSFAELLKRLLSSLPLSVCLSAWKNSAPHRTDFHII